MRDIGSTEGKDIKARVETSKTTLKFTCPKCGGHDLHHYYLSSWFREGIVDSVEVDLNDPSEYEVVLKSQPFERVSLHGNSFAFRCEACGFLPAIEEDANESYVDDEQTLVEWMIRNCDPAERPLDEQEVRQD